MLLEISQKSQENTLPETCNSIKKETLAQVVLVNFVKFLKTPFLQNTSGRLLLFVANTLIDNVKIYQKTNLSRYLFKAWIYETSVGKLLKSKQKYQFYHSLCDIFWEEQKNNFLTSDNNFVSMYGFRF